MHKVSLLNRPKNLHHLVVVLIPYPCYLHSVKESGTLSIKSDVYSFGVFLLELVTGREARSDRSIIQQVCSNYL